MKVLVLNGPNRGRLGAREPLIYGSDTHADLAELCEKTGRELGIDVETRQTDSEAQMISWLHEAADAGNPVVLNAAAWTHYSIAIRDACSQLTAPLIEVHISNVHTREHFRQHSVISAVATGSCRLLTQSRKLRWCPGLRPSLVRKLSGFSLSSAGADASSRQPWMWTNTQPSLPSNFSPRGPSAVPMNFTPFG